MKRIITVFLMVLGFSTSYSQDIQDCFEEIKKMTLINDSLSKSISENSKIHEQNKIQYQQNIKDLTDTIKTLKKELSVLSKFKNDKNNIETELEAKKDSISILKKSLIGKDKEILKIIEDRDLSLQNEKEKSERDAMIHLVNRYKDADFDNLIQISTLQSIQSDKELINNSEVRQLLNDLEIYFIAKELFNNKFDVEKVKNTKSKLQKLKHSSNLLDKLKEDLDDFNLYNEGLFKMLSKVDVIDENELAMDMGEEIRILKFNKILAEITTYIFMYDFNFIDYPYLSEIILDLIKLKRPNVDADIKHLIKRL